MHFSSGLPVLAEKHESRAHKKQRNMKTNKN
jgi:hypothetical protein